MEATSTKLPFQYDKLCFIRLILLIPTIGLLSTWAWWNDQSLFSWHYSLFWSSFLIVVCICLSVYYFGLSSSALLLTLVYPMSWFWHCIVLSIEFFGEDVKENCDFDKIIDDDLLYLFCVWPPGRLWLNVLRDGACLIIVICLILYFQFCHTLSAPHYRPFISAPFNGRPLNLPLTLNIRRNRMRREQRTRRQRRSSFIIHYVIVRIGQIRRRRRRK